jgi:transcriptional regulator with XRE-family HTH domain
MADLGKNLSEIRKSRRLTQQQLAELIHVQQRVISRWETGVAAPHLNHIVQLAEVLEVSLDRLIRGDEPGSPEARFEIRNRRLQELCQRVDQLGQADQEVVCHVMDSLIRKEQVRAIMSTTLPATP